MIIAKTCADVLPFDFALSPGGYFSDKVIFFEVDGTIIICSFSSFF